MKLSKPAAVLLTGLLLAGCSSASSSSEEPTSSPSPIAETSKLTSPTPESVIEDLQAQGLCNTTFDILETTANPNPGTGCVGLEGGNYLVSMVGQADSEEDAMEFAEEAFRTGASLRIDVGDMNSSDWLYSTETKLVIAANDDVVPTGNYAVIYTADDVSRPSTALQLNSLEYDAREWHGRCLGNVGLAKNLFDAPLYGESYDQCATGSRLTEINTFRGWWQMSPYLAEQKDAIQAPESDPFYAIIGDYWSVVDNTADKKEITKLQKAIGGEIIDLKSFDPEEYELDPDTLK